MVLVLNLRHLTHSYDLFLAAPAHGGYESWRHRSQHSVDLSLQKIEIDFVSVKRFHYVCYLAFCYVIVIDRDFRFVTTKQEISFKVWILSYFALL